MNKKTLNGILVVGGVAALVYLAYTKLYKKPTAMTRAEANDIVIKYEHTNYSNDTKYDDFVKKATDDYIIAWAKAIKDGNSTFPCGNPHGSQICNTLGGSTKK